MIDPRKSRERGSALLTSVVLSAVLFTLTTSFLGMMVSEKKSIQFSEGSLKAEMLAEAGVEEVFWEYNYGGGDFSAIDGWAGTDPKTKIVSGFTDASGSSVGNYTVQVTGPAGTAPFIEVTSTYTAEGPTASASTKTALVGKPLYDKAVKSSNGITISGNGYTDSYNSADGAYGPSNKAQNGDVLTTKATSGAISLSGNAAIKGDAQVGAGGSVSMTGNSTITGDVSADAAAAFDSISVPSYLSSLPSSGALSVAGNNTVTIPSGLYKYSSISVSGNGRLNINGGVELYVTGSVGISGNGKIDQLAGSTLDMYLGVSYNDSGNGIVNNNGTQNPNTLKIYGTNTCIAYNVSGNGTTVGLVNAPKANMAISGNAHFYGAVIVTRLTCSGNAGFHYDENLQNTGPFDGFKLRWHRRID